jgi:hypothetical protein
MKFSHQGNSSRKRGRNLDKNATSYDVLALVEKKMVCPKNIRMGHRKLSRCTAATNTYHTLYKRLISEYITIIK